MRRVFKLKRLKIAEQILIVLFCAVLIPMIVSGIVINNINQHAIRGQLQHSAELISKVVSEEIDVFILTAKSELKQVAVVLRTMPEENKKAYLNNLAKEFEVYKDLKIVNDLDNFDKLYNENLKKDLFTIYLKLDDGRYLLGLYDIDYAKKFLFRSLEDETREVYIVSMDKNIIASHNFSEQLFNKTMDLLPENLEDNKPVIFGDVKNQPLCYLKKDNPNLMVVVNTTEKVTQKTINDNRGKLLTAVFIASLSVFIIVAFYIYYMYINIRQLFKGIIAISQGNYERRIRLLINIFTPYEIVFLAFEFNKMASQIHKSYKELQKKNEELAQLNELRSNLIDTVSHELRTPLTSIQGYTSRLLRQDIQIDEELKQKSLRVIKKQSERLKRMIEDLLVIPDIERDRIQVDIEPIWLVEVLENAKLLIKNNEEKEIEFNVSEDFPLVYADKDKMEQVLINLLENAVKYSYEGTKIRVESDVTSSYASIKIINQSDYIPEDKLERLFEKFIRMDDKTTRTTRGTGLGLFIVKGLVEIMNGTITITSDKSNVFTAEVKLPLFRSVTVKP